MLLIIYSIILFVLFSIVYILYRTSEVEAPPQQKYPPYEPTSPDVFLPILKEHNCMPTSEDKNNCLGLSKCNIDSDCDSCEPKAGESFHCVNVDKQDINLPYNNKSCKIPKGKWCLPNSINKCNSDTSKTVLSSDGVREFWSCDCLYPQNMNLYRQRYPGGDCNVQVACGNLRDKSNRLVTRSRKHVKCIPSKDDSECIPEYVSNYTPGTATGSRNGPKFPLTFSKKPVGNKTLNWDAKLDGPLLYDSKEGPIPPWETSELNPKCVTDPTNPSCTSSKWGGKCRCDGFVDSNCKSPLTCQKYVPSTMVFPDQDEYWFQCIPDPCWRSDNTSGKLYLGELGPNAKGETPPYLNIGKCNCGNIKFDGKKYTSYVPTTIGGIPQCVKDSCNPGGYMFKDPNDPLAREKCVCNSSLGYKLSSGGTMCINRCDGQNTPCLNGGVCSIDKKGNVICDCPKCYTGEFCGFKLSKKGDVCTDNKECCSGKCHETFGGYVCT